MLAALLFATLIVADLPKAEAPKPITLSNEAFQTIRANRAEMELIKAQYQNLQAQYQRLQAEDDKFAAELCRKAGFGDVCTIDPQTRIVQAKKKE